MNEGPILSAIIAYWDNLNLNLLEEVLIIKKKVSDLEDSIKDFSK